MTTWLKKARMHLRLFFKSIRFRLTLWSTAILVVILLVFSIFVYYRQAQYLLVDTRVQLLDQAQRLASLYHLTNQAGTGPVSSQLPDLTTLNSGILSGSEARLSSGQMAAQSKR